MSTLLKWETREWRDSDDGQRVEVYKSPIGNYTKKVYSHLGYVVNTKIGPQFQPDDWDHITRPGKGFSLRNCGDKWGQLCDNAETNKVTTDSTTSAPFNPSKEISTVNYNINVIPVINDAFISQLLNANTGLIVWQSKPFTDTYIDAEKARGVDLARQAANDKLVEVEKNLFG